MISKKILQLLTAAALGCSLSLSAFGQQPGAAAPGDQVDQLATMLGLSEDQQTEIREAIDELSPQIETLQGKAQAVQQELQEKIRPDFDEAEIRETAAKLGELSGEMAALSAVLQATVQDIFTEEQRDQLEEQQRAQQQAQQQQMQQQMQRQMQQQAPQQ